MNANNEEDYENMDDEDCEPVGWRFQFDYNKSFNFKDFRKYTYFQVCHKVFEEVTPDFWWWVMDEEWRDELRWWPKWEREDSYCEDPELLPKSPRFIFSKKTIKLFKTLAGEI